jgi:hypothetical protein
MVIIIPEIEQRSVFSDEVLADLFAWAEQHTICLYCDKPIRYEEDEETHAEPFVGFEDFSPFGTLSQIFGTELSANTPIFLRNPESAEHRFND